MKNASKVLLVYLASLLVISLILSWLGYGYTLPLLQHKIIITPMMLVAIIGGFISLWITVPGNSFRIFSIVYGSLWVLRLLLIIIGNRIGNTSFFNKQLHVDFIISNYYSTVSRLDTPLPFIIYWIINYFFTLPNGKKKETAAD